MPAVVASASRTIPPGSAPRGSARRRVRGSRYQPATIATRPTGTLRKNTQRQPTAATSKPPSTGPDARPTACAAAWTPSAARRWRSGTLVTTSATLFAWSKAAPAAWTMRSAISIPIEAASPHAADAAAKITNPYRYSSLRPARSDQRPAGTSSVVSASRYASETHCTAGRPAWNCRCSAGKATVTMLASSWPMNAPKHTVPTANHGASRCSRTIAGRADSRSKVTTGDSRRAAGQRARGATPAASALCPSPIQPSAPRPLLYICNRTILVLFQSFLPQLGPAGHAAGNFVIKWFALRCGRSAAVTLRFPHGGDGGRA